jgi:hypothetical protein
MKFRDYYYGPSVKLSEKIYSNRVYNVNFSFHSSQRDNQKLRVVPISCCGNRIYPTFNCKIISNFKNDMFPGYVKGAVMPISECYFRD